ncbi:cyclopropane-fatty-acyl-phospholipid synthase family protein [Chitinibacter sp. ZOR0017]|uniref:SAM-dependent methyltransferase n=1 Tax=Chitinibacter sp. ZOR0017 TaxID=1339254 RepID=UPI000648A4F0|nr:cyclopropane-fatty-acyl-phospholipid synthase family protein [Chitinibacter sp. ZOR0017]
MSQTRTLASTAQRSAAMPAAARVFLSLLGRLQQGHLQLQTPEGDYLTFGNLHEPPSAFLQISDWRACQRILQAGDIGFAESYQAGWIDSPDLTSLLRLAIRNEAVLEQMLFGGWLGKLWYRLKHLLRANTRRGSQKNIHAHYDIGNDFYRLWLDPSWTYSSAVFAGDLQQSLQAAQVAKYQRIIDVLGLKAGDRVLEIGCGWGGFAEQAGRQGIAVHGITISPSQLAVAQARIDAARLNDLVALEICDYRDLTGQYDAIVSIEMFEAVGEAYWPRYFSTVAERLKPGGKALVQSITIDEAYFERYRSGTDFIQQYIFPGGMLPSPSGFVAQAAKAGLSTAEQYRFGPDYAETLRRWRQGFEAALEAVRGQGFDEAFIRIWRLYLCYCEAGFDEGRTDVVQFCLQK